MENSKILQYLSLRVHCLLFNWGGRRMICLGEQGGSAPFPPDLQELLQGVRNQSGQWSWEFCRVLCWRNPPDLESLRSFYLCFSFMSALSPPCTLMDSLTLWNRILELYHSAETRSCGTAGILSPAPVWTPLHSSGLCCHLLRGDSHPDNSLPEWGDSCKPIPMEFSVPLDSHTQFNLHSNFTTFIFLPVPQQRLYWTPFFSPLLTPSCQRIEKTIHGERIGANPFSPDTKVPILMHSVCFTQVLLQCACKWCCAYQHNLQNQWRALEWFTVKSGKEILLFVVKVLHRLLTT